MIQSLKNTFLFSLMVCMVAIQLYAQSGDALVSNLEAYKVITSPNGTLSLQKAEKAHPGDVIEYQLNYQNSGISSIRSLTPVLPVPEGMVFLPDTTVERKVLASLDGELYSKIPLEREVVTVNGDVITETVPFEEYRFLKWFIVELRANQKVLLKARMQVVASKDESMQ